MKKFLLFCLTGFVALTVWGFNPMNSTLRNPFELGDMVKISGGEWHQLDVEKMIRTTERCSLFGANNSIELPKLSFSDIANSDALYGLGINSEFGTPMEIQHSTWNSKMGSGLVWHIIGGVVGAAVCGWFIYYLGDNLGWSLDMTTLSVSLGICLGFVCYLPFGVIGEFCATAMNSAPIYQKDFNIGDMELTSSVNLMHDKITKNDAVGLGLKLRL